MAWPVLSCPGNLASVVYANALHNQLMRNICCNEFSPLELRFLLLIVIIAIIIMIIVAHRIVFVCVTNNLLADF